MHLINKIRDYLLEEEFKITILKNKINMVNYKKLGIIDDNKVQIYYSDGNVLVSGKNLVVSKLLQDEILVTGLIQNIELR